MTDDRTVTHSDEISEWSTKKYTGLDVNKEIVLCIADTLHTVPPVINNEYKYAVEKAASFVRKYITKNSKVNSKIVVTSNNVLKPYNSSNEETINDVFSARNIVFDFVNEVNSFISRSKNKGIVIKKNPLSVISSLNAGRVGFSQIEISDAKAKEIINDLNNVIKLLEEEDIEEHTNNVAQLSSTHMSLEGLGGSGDSALDLMQFLPSMDLLREQKANRSSNLLDFSKQIPKILFTSTYSPDGRVMGSVVGWQKMSEASGYIIKRRSIFDNKETKYVITNEELELRWKHLSDYVKTWITSFYDNIDDKNIASYLDSDIEPNQYYSYTIQGFQSRKQNTGAMFNVATSAFRIIDKNRFMLQLAHDKDKDNPYRVLSKFILGDAKYDWVLSGVNIRASITRGDQASDTRKYSYITADVSFLIEQMEKEMFVFPKMLADIIQNVHSSISQFGIMQTLREIVQETGILYYFDGKDKKPNLYFTNVDVIRDDESGFLSTLASSIDPETATVDTETLAINLPRLIAGSSIVEKGSKESAPSEIEIAGQEDNSKFVEKAILDVTSFDGISSLVTAIRNIADIGTFRETDLTDKKLESDPIPEDLPPPPPKPVIAPTSVVVNQQVNRPRPKAFTPRKIS